MDKIKKMALTLLVFAIGFGIMNVNATQWTVGVKAGDWAVYSFDGNKGTSIWNETVKVEVTSVISTTIYYSLTWNPPVANTDPELNPILSNTGCIDVQTQDESSVNYIEYFIAVNGTGTTLGGVDTSMSRTEPNPMQYLGQTFERCSIVHVIARGKGIQEDLYWIKSIGLLTEVEISGTGFSLTMHITSASVIPEFPSFLILPLFMTATLLAVIVYKRKYH